MRPLKLGIALIGSLLLSTNISAKNLDSRLNGLELSPLDERLQKEIRELVKRHDGGNVRVDACPLKSERYQDILGKIQTLHTLFKDSCLDSDQARLNEILTSAQNIQNSLNQIHRQTPSDSDATGDSSPSLDDLTYSGSDGTTVNGNQIATVFNGINSVFLNGQCDFDKGSFLNQTADVVQSFAQMGLLVPSQTGIVVAGGGMAISSILRAIDNIFTKRFDFENIEDRQTFIKLNCGFYDLRREVEKTGMMDVPTKEHEKVIKQARELHQKTKDKLKENSKNKKAIKQTIEEAKKNFAKNQLGFLTEFEKELKKGLKLVEEHTKEQAPAESLKLQVIYKMSQLAPKLSPMLAEYQDSLEENTLFDDLFANLLAKFQQYSSPLEFESLVEKKPKSFFAEENAKLQFHFSRLVKSVGQKKEELLKRWEEETTIDDLPIRKYLAQLEKKSTSLKKSLQKTQKRVAVVISRLERILSYKGYRGGDDGTESIVDILDQYEKVAAQIYGEWGQEFMTYATYTAHEQNEKFKERFREFRQKHLRNGKIPPRKERDQLQLISACQDAVPYRRNWKKANALTQQGYDFISANKELFFSDVSSSFFGFNSDFKTLRYHFKSAHYASLILRGEDVPEKYIEKYIEPKYSYNHNSRDRTGPVDREERERKEKRRYIGKAMLDASKARSQAGLLQKLIENYHCSKVMADSE